MRVIQFLHVRDCLFDPPKQATMYYALMNVAEKRHRFDLSMQYIYICMYVCMYVCIYIFMYVYI